MPSRLTLSLSAAAVAVAVAVAGISQLNRPEPAVGAFQPPIATAAGSPSAAPASPAPEPSLTVAPAPDDLPTLSYWSAPQGFPADTDPASAAPVTEGLRPARKLAVYDAPGGRPLAFLPVEISRMPVTVPIVAHRSGWAGVLLPTLNRRVGWLPPAGWTAETLHDQLVVNIAAHRLVWLRDGVEQASISVATGAAATPTPLGRTYVMGRTRTSGKVYAGVDALVLGAIPENREALAEEIKNGHTAIHGWYRPSAFGHSVSNGCVRLSAENQRRLLAGIAPGTVVHIIAG